MRYLLDTNILVIYLRDNDFSHLQGNFIDLVEIEV